MKDFYVYKLLIDNGEFEGYTKNHSLKARRGMSMKKRLVALLLAVGLLASVTAGAEEVVTYEEELPSEEAEALVEEESFIEEEIEEPSEVYLSVDEAIEIALENNPQLEAADAKIRSAEINKEVAEEQVKEYKDFEDSVPNVPKVKMMTTINVSNGLEQAYLKHGYYSSASQVALDLAVKEKEQITAKISYDVTEKYYNVKLMEKILVIARGGLKTAEDNLSAVKAHFEAGYVSQLEVRNAENAVTDAKFSVEEYERNYIVAISLFKLALGQDECDYTYVLTDEIVIPEMPVDYEKRIEEALESRYDMTALFKSMELSEMCFDITEYYVFDSTAIYNSAYSDYLNAEYTYNNAKKGIRISLMNDYNTIITAKNKVTSCENAMKIKQTEYDSAVIKYEMGIITNLELTAAMTALDQSKVQYENAVVTYLLAVMKFDYNTTIGI